MLHRMNFANFPHYRPVPEHVDIDIEKLRPDNSYDYLIQNRSHFLSMIQSHEGEVSPEKLELVACPSCGSKLFNPITRKDGLCIVQCQHCSLIYVNPRVKESEYEQLYAGGNYGHIVTKLALASHLYRKDRFGSERLAILQKYHNPDLSKTLLDLGSGSGFFIEKAREQGWDSYGIELSPPAVNFSRQRGNKVYDQILLNLSLPSESVSAVTMFDVLEHLPNPREHLVEVSRILPNGGILFIYVPNWNSASRLLLGDSAHFIWPTHHLTYFTPETLETFVASNGFSIEYLATEGLDIVDWIWQQKKIGANVDLVAANIDTLQFLVNAGGWGKNLRMVARKI